jgi:hypothetical protein
MLKGSFRRLQYPVGKKIGMGKLLGLLLGALSIGVSVGVLFQLAYPDAEISSDLGLLFALVGLVLSWLIRAGWQVLRGR